jgi:hypothetical protein
MYCICTIKPMQAFFADLSLIVAIDFDRMVNSRQMQRVARHVTSPFKINLGHIDA